MALLEVKHLKKTYTTRFGGTKVEALKDVEFSVEKGEYVAIMGGIRFRKNNPAEYSGGAGQTHRR